MELLRYLSSDSLDTPYRFDVKLLRRELQGGVTRVNSCKLYVLGDSISDNLTVFCHAIKVYLLSMFDELAHHDGVF